MVKYGAFWNNSWVDISSLLHWSSENGCMHVMSCSTCCELEDGGKVQFPYVESTLWMG